MGPSKLDSPPSWPGIMMNVFMDVTAMLIMFLFGYAIGFAGQQDPSLSVSQGIWLFRQEKFEDAEHAFAAAIEENPTHEQAHLWRARALTKLNRLPEAEAALRHGLDRIAESAELTYSLGKVLEQQGRVSDAKHYYASIADRHTGARAALAALDQPPRPAKPPAAGGGRGTERVPDTQPTAGHKRLEPWTWAVLGGLAAVVLAYVIVRVLRGLSRLFSYARGPAQQPMLVSAGQPVAPRPPAESRPGGQYPRAGPSAAGVRQAQPASAEGRADRPRSSTPGAPTSGSVQHAGPSIASPADKEEGRSPTHGQDGDAAYPDEGGGPGDSKQAELAAQGSGPRRQRLRDGRSGETPTRHHAVTPAGAASTSAVRGDEPPAESEASDSGVGQRIKPARDTESATAGRDSATTIPESQRQQQPLRDGSPRSASRGIPSPAPRPSANLPTGPTPQAGGANGQTDPRGVTASPVASPGQPVTPQRPVADGQTGRPADDAPTASSDVPAPSVSSARTDESSGKLVGPNRQDVPRGEGADLEDSAGGAKDAHARHARSGAGESKTGAPLSPQRVPPLRSAPRSARDEQASTAAPLLIDPALSPDGTRIVFASPSALCVLDLNGGRVTVLRPGHFRRPVWSPDGAWIACEELSAAEKEVLTASHLLCERIIGTVVLLRANGADYRMIGPPGDHCGSPTWMGNQAVLFVRMRTSRLLPCDLHGRWWFGHNVWAASDALLVYELPTGCLRPRATPVPLPQYDRVEWLPLMHMLTFCTVDFDDAISSVLEYIAARHGPIGRRLRSVRTRSFAAGAGRNVPPFTPPRNYLRPILEEAVARTVPRFVRPAPDFQRAIVEEGVALIGLWPCENRLTAASVSRSGNHFFAWQETEEKASVVHACGASWSSDGKSIVFVSAGRTVRPGLELLVNHRSEPQGESLVIADPDLRNPEMVFTAEIDPALPEDERPRRARTGSGRPRAGRTRWWASAWSWLVQIGRRARGWAARRLRLSSSRGNVTPAARMTPRPDTAGSGEDDHA